MSQSSTNTSSRTQAGDHGTNLIHTVCECTGDDKALCGAAIEGEEWVEDVPTPDDCLVCEDLFEHEFCPFSGALHGEAPDPP